MPCRLQADPVPTVRVAIADPMRLRIGLGQPKTQPAIDTAQQRGKTAELRTGPIVVPLFGSHRRE